MEDTRVPSDVRALCSNEDYCAGYRLPVNSLGFSKGDSASVRRDRRCPPRLIPIWPERDKAAGYRVSARLDIVSLNPCEGKEMTIDIEYRVSVSIRVPVASGGPTEIVAPPMLPEKLSRL